MPGTTVISETSHDLRKEQKISFNNVLHYPDHPILVFFHVFFVFRCFLVLGGSVLSFPRILGVPRREKLLIVFFFAFFSPKKQGLEGLDNFMFTHTSKRR